MFYNYRLFFSRRTLLYWSLSELDVCKLLLDSEVDVNAKDKRCDARPLLTTIADSIFFGFERCKWCLLFSGETALHWCTKYGSIEVGKFLLESKADVDATNDWCDTRGAPHAHAYENEGAFIVVLKVVT